MTVASLSLKEISQSHGAAFPHKLEHKRAESPPPPRPRSTPQLTTREPTHCLIDDETLVPIDLVQSMLKAARAASNSSGQHTLIASETYTCQRTYQLVTQERLVELRNASRHRESALSNKALTLPQAKHGGQAMVKGLSAEGRRTCDTSARVDAGVCWTSLGASDCDCSL